MLVGSLERLAGPKRLFEVGLDARNHGRTRPTELACNGPRGQEVIGRHGRDDPRVRRRVVVKGNVGVLQHVLQLVSPRLDIEPLARAVDLDRKIDTAADDVKIGSRRACSGDRRDRESAIEEMLGNEHLRRPADELLPARRDEQVAELAPGRMRRLEHTQRVAQVRVVRVREKTVDLSRRLTHERVRRRRASFVAGRREVAGERR